MQTTESITVSVNGDARHVDEGTLLPAILSDFGIDVEEIRGVAVAINDAIVRRADWAARRIEAGDRIEIVTARQGG